MKSLLIITAALFSFFTFAQSPTPSWINMEDGLQSKVLAVDEFGNSYVGSTFAGTINLEIDSVLVPLTSLGASDILIQKLDAIGNCIWAYRCGGPEHDFIGDIAVDGNGDVIVTGQFKATISFGITSLSPEDEWDGFVLKLNSSGGLLWVKQLKGQDDELIKSISVVESGEIYLCGSYNGELDLSDFGNQAPTYTSNGSFDMFVVNISSAGVYEWSKSMGGVGPDHAFELIAIHDGVDLLYELFVVGSFSNTVEFGSPGSILLTSNVTSDGCLIKFNYLEEVIEVHAFEGANIQCTNLALETLEGGWSEEAVNIFIGGTFNVDVDMDPGSAVVSASANGVNHDVFIVRLNQSLDYMWSTHFGDIGPDYLNSMLVNDNGNLFISGDFVGDIQLIPNPPFNTLTSSLQNGYGICVAMFQPFFMTDPAEIIWSEAIVSQATTLTNGGSIALDLAGNLYLVGFTEGAVDFGTNGQSNILSPQTMNSAGFVVKYGDSPIGIHENEPTTISVYPNPASQYLTVNSTELIKSIDLIDVVGKTHLSTKNSSNFFVGDVPSGTYFLVVKTESGKEIVEKLIIE